MLRKSVISVVLLLAVFVAQAQVYPFGTMVKEPGCADVFVQPKRNPFKIIKEALSKRHIDTVICYMHYNAQGDLRYNPDLDWGIILWVKNHQCFGRQIQFKEFLPKITRKTKVRTLISSKINLGYDFATSFKGQAESQKTEDDKKNQLDGNDKFRNDGRLLCQYGSEVHCFEGVNERLESLKAAFSKPHTHKHFSCGPINRSQ